MPFSQELTLFPSHLLMESPAPWSLLRRSRHEWPLDGLSHSLLASPTLTPKMAMDMKENDTQYEFVVDIPGVDKDATKIELKDHVLTISTERKSVKSSETELVRRSERYVGCVSRSVSLPEDADEDKIEARFAEGGVLHIEVPKLAKDAGKRRRVIEIAK